MCSTPSIETVTTSSEVIKNATQANASVQKSSDVSRQNVGAINLGNIKTSPSGLLDAPNTDKKKLLGE